MAKILRFFDIATNEYSEFIRKNEDRFLKDSMRLLYVSQNQEDFDEYCKVLHKSLGSKVRTGSSKLPKFPCAVYSWILGSSPKEGILLHIPFTEVDGLLIMQATRAKANGTTKRTTKSGRAS